MCIRDRDTVDARLDGGRVPVRIRQTFAGRPPQRTLGVEGEGGSVTVDLLTGRVTATGSWAPHADALARPDHPRNQMFMDVALNFVRAVRGEAAPATPLEDGTRVLALALAVKRAIASGRTEEIA